MCQEPPKAEARPISNEHVHFNYHPERLERLKQQSGPRLISNKEDAAFWLRVWEEMEKDDEDGEDIPPSEVAKYICLGNFAAAEEAKHADPHYKDYY